MIPNLLKPPPPSLELFRKYVSEIETTFASINILKDKAAQEGKVSPDHVLEIAKLLGYLAGLAQEINLLSGDLKGTLTQASSPIPPVGALTVDKLEALLNGDLAALDDYSADVLPFPGRGKKPGPVDN